MCGSWYLDYGFTKQPSGIDLINHRWKIAVELKNGYRINSIVRREDFRRLKEFKRQHPRYIVILGFINDKTVEGKYRVKKWCSCNVRKTLLTVYI